ncbi:MAG: anti-sigma factor [Acidimicrobiales bacterium]|nr:anti-sigma factor [Acidimicrobiales bacterium]
MAAQTTFGFDTNLIGWVPLAAGLSFKPLTFFPGDTGYQLLLRLEPGTIIPRHRHTGEVHAFNIEGSRRILTTDEVVGPGTYIHEPVGNTDTWQAVGEDVCIVHIEANGRVEYLDDDDNVVRHTSATTARADYLAWCDEHHVTPHPALVSP